MNWIKKLLFIVLDISYFITQGFYKIFTFYQRSNIRVLIYHDVKTEEQIKLFKKQILIYQKNMILFLRMIFKKKLIIRKVKIKYC